MCPTASHGALPAASAAAWQAFQAAGLQVICLPTTGQGAMLWQAFFATLLHRCCKRVAQVGTADATLLYGPRCYMAKVPQDARCASARRSWLTQPRPDSWLSELTQPT